MPETIYFTYSGVSLNSYPVAYRGRFWGGSNSAALPPKFRRPSKIVSTSTRLWKLLKIAEFRTPTPQDVRKKGSKILKLSPVRNCFTLAMTHKLVVIINTIKVPKIKKILLYEMKFLVPNYSCLQNPWLEGYGPQIPVLSVLNWICWPSPPSEQNSWVRHCSYPTDVENRVKSAPNNTSKWQMGLDSSFKVLIVAFVMCFYLTQVVQ